MTSAPLSPPIPGRNPWLIAPVVAIAAFMEILDISIANVALRHIAGDLSAGQDESTWILTSYLVTNAIILPLSGWLSTIMGRKRFFLTCIIGFSASSLLCGLAPSLKLLILFRAIQGLTGGGLQPSAQSILADAFPPHQRGMAFALYGMAVVFAPAIGPTLGGWLTDSASWRWVFLINVPVGMALIPMVLAMVQDPPHAVEERRLKLERGFKLDYLGFTLLVLGLGCLQIMLDKGEEMDWFNSPFIVTLAIVSAVSSLAFVLWELGQEEPIVNLRLLRSRNFAVSNVLLFMLGFVLMGSTVLLPELVQTVFQYTATEAGLVLTPGGLSIIFLMPIIGKLVSRFDSRWLIIAGFLCSAFATNQMSGFDMQTEYWSFVWARIYFAVGLSFLFIPINTVSYVGLPPTASNQASSITNLSRNLGGSVGISLVTTLLTERTQVHQSVLSIHMDRLSPAYLHYRDLLIEGLQRQGHTLMEAGSLAQGKIYGLLSLQAQMLAFLDDFTFLTVAFLAMTPLVFLMKKGVVGRPPAGGGH